MTKIKYFISFLILLALAIFLLNKFAVAQDNNKQWGVYAGDDVASLKSFQEKLGAKPNIVALFTNYSDPFPNEFASNLKQNNQTLALFWEQYNASLDDIISGEYDFYIKQFAKDAAAYGAPVILLPLHEMNGNWDPWGGTVKNNTPLKVVKAFQHMHNVFDGVGAPNVKWGWDVNNDSVPDIAENAIENYYPGDQYVDYVGVDGFNFGDPWQSYANVFSSSLGKLRKYNKPIYIFSMACKAGPQKALWIADATEKIKLDSTIAGWIWFNEDKEENWAVWSDELSLKAFLNAVK